MRTSVRKVPDQVLSRSICPRNGVYQPMNEIISKQISDVPWTTIESSHGNARAVPRTLVDITSTDAKTRDKAYHDMMNWIVCQSDLYEAAYYATPILIEMLRQRETPGRDLIYDVLWEVAHGYAPEEWTPVFKNGVRITLMQACREAVVAGLDVYHQDQNDSDEAVRTNVKALLELLREMGLVT